MDIEKLKSGIFNIGSFDDFNAMALQIFHFQYQNNATYRKFIDLLSLKIHDITSCYNIPCLPVELFKTNEIRSVDSPPELIFKSSGTSSGQQSRHLVFSRSLYEKSILQSFSSFFGNPEDYIILALIPDFKIAKASSLAFMLDLLIKKSGQPESGFYLNKTDELATILQKKSGRKKILFGITYALLDFAENQAITPENTLVIETGGMKGRRKEMTRDELYGILTEKLRITDLYSEYSMCELMSQAYSLGGGQYKTPLWMKIYTRELNDPFAKVENEKSGGINIIDLANLFTCSFISTQDIGILHKTGTFEVLGRFDYSDTRGCSLLA